MCPLTFKKKKIVNNISFITQIRALSILLKTCDLPDFCCSFAILIVSVFYVSPKKILFFQCDPERSKGWTLLDYMNHLYFFNQAKSTEKCERCVESLSCCKSESLFKDCPKEMIVGHSLEKWQLDAHWLLSGTINYLVSIHSILKWLNLISIY